VLVGLTVACQTEPEVLRLEQLAQPWDSPECYDSHGLYLTAAPLSTWSCQWLKAEGPPRLRQTWPLGGASAAELLTAIVDGTVEGDTAQGWQTQGALAGRRGLLLGKLKNHNPVRPMPYDTLFLEYASGAKGRWQDLSGLRIRAEARVRSLSGKEIRPMGYILRTTDGQLLTVTLYAMFWEYFAEVLPEIRLRPVTISETLFERSCKSKLGQGHERYRTAGVEVITLNETKVLGPCQAVRIAVGCVEYVILTGKLEQRVSDDCYLQDAEIELTVTRRALLDQASDPFR